jgi:hypothetical protein
MCIIYTSTSLKKFVIVMIMVYKLAKMGGLKF